MAGPTAFDEMTAAEWCAWVHSLDNYSCCPGWPHLDDHLDLAAFRRGWRPIRNGFHVDVWVHPDLPGQVRVRPTRTAGDPR